MIAPASQLASPAPVQQASARPGNPPPDTLAEGFHLFEGEWFYKIADYDEMPPFFINLVSPQDHWFFISTTGGLTCGRESADSALFPYEPEDKVRDSHTHSGPVTWMRLKHRGETVLWKPFSAEALRRYKTTRNLYKNATGNIIVFEEINHDLSLAFRYRWSTSGLYGFVRSVRLENLSRNERSLEILDGLRNLLPPGIERRLNLEFSCLTQAYKSAERIGTGSLAVYTLSSGITDHAVPMEALLATTAWSTGLPSPQVLLSNSAVEDFLAGRPARPQIRLRGRRGAYLLRDSFTLPGGQSLAWTSVLDVRQSQTRVKNLECLLAKSPDHLLAAVETDIRAGTQRLRQLASASDGLQLTGDRPVSHHHFTNTLFNLMRGGIFSGHYTVSGTDFSAFIRSCNRPLADKSSSFLASLPSTLPHASLKQRIEEQNNPDLSRLFLEYLPLTFSRRHGDPSRPWNHFSIRIADESGQPVLDYQGNWRDIFQNWEALALAYPLWLPHMITRFVNASTADGYNPYRLMRAGFEWEEPNPDDPWSGIGYWGDHQIIYLLKLLELARDFNPEDLQDMLRRPICTYAHVPYEIADFPSLCRNPRNSISFNQGLNNLLLERFREIGADGKLLQGRNGLYRVTLTEKLVVPVLAKLSNLIPGGGIWMNTQRPEWNDANNALVGYGVSMVTLCYLRRHLVFLLELLGQMESEDITLSREVGALADALLTVFEQPGTAAACHDSKLRFDLMGQLGEAGGHYRQRVYQHGLSGTTLHPMRRILALFRAALPLLDDTIRLNRRDDGLYHSYNLLSFGDECVEIRHLDVMLEGQVAVLSAGLLSPEESATLLSHLRRSPLYREDQKSYLLYPNKELPGFLEKNSLSPTSPLFLQSKLLQNMLQAGDTRILSRDEGGVLRFHPACTNAAALGERLSNLRGDPVFGPAAIEEESLILEIYEEVFRHHAFTGRSGTMFAYEGLGSIYWHMVAKLLLAVQENLRLASLPGTPSPVLHALEAHYNDIRSGLGFNKTSRDYGAFPVDPYSHTPSHSGAQQPGMTGLVKEEILTRFGELGVEIRGGCVHLSPRFLNLNELCTTRQDFEYFNVFQEPEMLELLPGTLAFTVCQVPVIYRNTLPAGRVVVQFRDGSSRIFHDGKLDRECSSALFNRTGSIRLVESSSEQEVR